MAQQIQDHRPEMSHSSDPTPTTSKAKPTARDLVAQYLQSRPRPDFQQTDLAFYCDCFTYQENEANIPAEDRETFERELNYRLFHVIALATDYKNELRLDFPNCEDWHVREWTDEEAKKDSWTDVKHKLWIFYKDEHLKRLFHCPWADERTLYYKGRMYLAALFASSGWSKQRINFSIYHLAEFKVLRNMAYPPPSSVQTPLQIVRPVPASIPVESVELSTVQLIRRYFRSKPGSDELEGNSPLHSNCDAFLEYDPDTTIYPQRELNSYEVENMRENLKYRLEVVELANHFRDIIGIDFPDCKKWSTEEWQMEQSQNKKFLPHLKERSEACVREVKRAGLFRTPANLVGPEFMKGVYYLSALFATTGWSIRDIAGVLSILKKEKTKRDEDLGIARKRPITHQDEEDLVTENTVEDGDVERDSAEQNSVGQSYVEQNFVERIPADGAFFRMDLSSCSALYDHPQGSIIVTDLSSYTSLSYTPVYCDPSRNDFVSCETSHENRGPSQNSNESQ